MSPILRGCRSGTGVTGLLLSRTASWRRRLLFESGKHQPGGYRKYRGHHKRVADGDNRHLPPNLLDECSNRRQTRNVEGDENSEYENLAGGHCLVDRAARSMTIKIADGTEQTYRLRSMRPKMLEEKQRTRRKSPPTQSCTIRRKQAARSPTFSRPINLGWSAIVPFVPADSTVSATLPFL